MKRIESPSSLQVAQTGMVATSTYDCGRDKECGTGAEMVHVLETSFSPSDTQRSSDPSRIYIECNQSI